MREYQLSEGSPEGASQVKEVATLASTFEGCPSTTRSSETVNSEPAQPNRPTPPISTCSQKG